MFVGVFRRSPDSAPHVKQVIAQRVGSSCELHVTLLSVPPWGTQVGQHNRALAIDARRRVIEVPSVGQFTVRSNSACQFTSLVQP